MAEAALRAPEGAPSDALFTLVQMIEDLSSGRLRIG